MNDRLVAFLQAEQLNPARFAELMNIQRSGVSHLLSGRNKPGYDFFEKFLHKFPSINIEWLISGRGKMYKEQNSSTLFPETKPASPLVKDEESYPYGYMYNASPAGENTQHVEPGRPGQPEHPEPVKQDKQIQKVILFYDDGSFEVFK